MAAPHPDEPPFVHGRDLVPIRRNNLRYKDARREAIFAEEDELRRQLDQVDQALVDLTVERRRLLQQIEALHDQVRPCSEGARGRRARAVTHEEPLPPIAARPCWLIGRPLRAVCLAFLRRAPEPLTLRQLHVILHRCGYAIVSPVPVKTLADALGHETTAGRARRVRRGTYTVTKVPPSRWEPADPTRPPTPAHPVTEDDVFEDEDVCTDTETADAAPLAATTTATTTATATTTESEAEAEAETEAETRAQAGAASSPAVPPDPPTKEPSPRDTGPTTRTATNADAAASTLPDW
jgi:hypothetical protein